LNRYIVGVFLVIVSGVCYGFSPILAVYAYRGGASVADYVFLRYGIASLFICYTFLFTSAASLKRLAGLSWHCR